MRSEISPHGSGQVLEYMPGRLPGSTSNLHGYQAEPNAGFEFISWTGSHINENGYTTDNPYDHVWEDNQHPSGNFIITANFRRINPAPYYAIEDSAGGIISLSNQYLSNLSQEVRQSYTAIPSDGYEFIFWEIHGIEEPTTANPYHTVFNPHLPTTLELKPIRALFRLIDPPAYYYILQSEGGTVSYRNEYISGLSKELNQTYTATPEAGYEFARWEIYKNQEIQTETEFTYTYDPHQPTTRDLKPIKAIFRKLAPTNSFYAMETATGGSANVSIERISETKIRELYTATPAANYAFRYWLINEMILRGRVYVHEYDPTRIYPTVIQTIQPVFSPILPGADLSGSDFSGLQLKNISFQNNNLSQADFRQCTFENVEIRINDYPGDSSYLQDTDFSGANLSGLTVSSGNDVYSDIFNSGIIFTSPTPDFEALNQEVQDLRAQLEEYERNNQLKLSTDEVLDLRIHSMGAAMENNILHLEMDIETSDSLEEGTWHSLKDTAGNKVKARASVPIEGNKRFYRIKR
ncbi:MAG: InlB B-repeat-containing protein [Coraliomargaritaceae bacterium]